MFVPEAYITATRQFVAQANNWSLEELALEVQSFAKWQRLSVCLYVRLFVCASVLLFVCSFVRLFVCSSVRLFVCLFVRLFASSCDPVFVCSFVVLIVRRLSLLTRKANARNVSFRRSLLWPVFIINSADKTKLPFV